jgi:hypothetical protein
MMKESGISSSLGFTGFVLRQEHMTQACPGGANSIVTSQWNGHGNGISSSVLKSSDGKVITRVHEMPRQHEHRENFASLNRLTLSLLE